MKASQVGNKPKLDVHGGVLSVDMNDPGAKEKLQQALRSLKGFTFRCKNCGKVQEGDSIPRNWFSIAIRKPYVHGENTYDWKRLGLFCSVSCVESEIPHLVQEVEDQPLEASK